MPRKVTAYACVFRCGKKCTTKKADMVYHEMNCFQNPKARCCPTCRYQCIERPYLGYHTDEAPDEHYGRWCTHPDNEIEWCGRDWKFLPLDGLDDKGRYRIARRCLGWEGEVEVKE